MSAQPNIVQKRASSAHALFPHKHLVCYMRRWAHPASQGPGCSSQDLGKRASLI